MRLRSSVVAAVAIVTMFAHCGAAAHRSTPSVGTQQGIHKIQHVIFIVQENRSFDNYFGTYPGADGLPRSNGHFTVCQPDPLTHGCERPFHDTSDCNVGGPHSESSMLGDIDHGRMDGFVNQYRKGSVGLMRGSVVAPSSCQNRARHDNPRPDVMGFHTAHELPTYWAYARNYVLQDHMFEPSYGSSMSAHLYMVSGWSAYCSDAAKASTCRSRLEQLDNEPRGSTTPNFGWTDLTWLLHRAGVSWGYYVDPGTQPDCDDGSITCSPKPQLVGTREIWNPLPDFQTVHQDRETSKVQSVDNFTAQAKAGTLPAVSWIAPNGVHSEHPPALLSTGQRYVSGLINAVMQGPDWSSSAIFLFWDDWGGFYDHAVPPKADGLGYGIRVPALVISPYAKKGLVDHQVLSFDAYLKFVEDDFLGGQRIDPKTDGRPDPRPDVRENASILGDLTRDFDFSQSPRPPVILSGP